MSRSKKCTITVVDEVNALVTGLGGPTRRQIRESLTWFEAGHKQSPMFQLGKWDGTRCLFNQGWTFVRLIDDRFLKIIERAGYEVVFDDRRVAPPPRPPVDLDGFVFRRPDSEVVPWEHQADSFRALLGGDDGICVVATGGGKSYVAAMVARAYGALGRVLTIVPRLDLVSQTAKAFREAGLAPAEYSGISKENSRIVVTTWQSLANAPELCEGVACLICDECHQGKAAELQKILSGPAKDVQRRYGFTATMPDNPLDRALIRSVLGEVVVEFAAAELQRRGILAGCDVTMIASKEDDRVFPDYAKEQVWLVSDPERLAWISEMVSEIATSGNTLVLVKNIETGKTISEAIPGATFISGRTSQKNRTKVFDELKDSDNRVIVATRDIAGTGTDAPRIFNVVLVEPGKSPILVIQMIGRGMRKTADKNHVRVYDLHATTKYSSYHAVQRRRLYRRAGYPYETMEVDYRA